MIWKTLGILLVLLVPACQEKEYPELGEGVAGPVAVALSGNEQHFYVLNSDFDRTYDAGSILVLDTEGDRVGVIPIPRLGRSLDIFGKYMLVTYDRPEEEGSQAVELYQLYDSALDSGDYKDPSLVQRWDISCTAIGVVMEENYPYFFISCLNGALYVGDKDQPQEPLKMVRKYAMDRRALFLDTNRELLLGFPVDLRAQNYADQVYTDIKSYSADGRESEGSNEIPDQFEDNRRERRNIGRRRPYKMFIFDIAASKAEDFKERTVGDVDDATAEVELRWLYYELKTSDGELERPGDIRSETTTRFYRTNFWQAQPHESKASSFYLSQRGTTSYSNNILEVTLGNGYQSVPAQEGSCPEDYRIERDFCIPFTNRYLEVTRVYGGSGMSDDKHYTNDFVIKNVSANGSSAQMLAINHFRDLVNWPKDAQRFSIVSQDIDDQSSRRELQSSDFKSSYLGIAMTSSGRAATVSYYGNAILLFDLVPSQDPVEVRRIP